MPPVDAQVSRVSAEALTKALVEAQVSRVSAEALVKALVESQISRVSAEALVRTVGQAQVSRVSAEVLRQAVELFSQAQVSRVSVEALTRALVEAQVSRLSVEALTYYEPFLAPVELAADSSLAADVAVVKHVPLAELRGDSDLGAIFTVSTGTIPNLGSSWVLEAEASPIYTSIRADLTGEGRLTADATVSIGPVALEGSSSLNASAQIVIAQHRIAANLQGVGQLSADVRITGQRLQGDLDGDAGLDAFARVETTVATSLEGEGSLTASAFISSFKVDLAATSTLEAGALVEQFLEQNLDGSSSLDATLQPIDHRVAADLRGESSFTADAWVEVLASFTGESSLSATAGVTTFGSAGLAGDSDLYGDLTLNTWYGRASISGVGGLEVRATTITRWAAADLAGQGSLDVVDVLVHIDQDLLLAGEGSLAAVIIKIVPIRSRLRSNAGFSITATVAPGTLRADLRGEGSLEATVATLLPDARGTEVHSTVDHLLRLQTSADEEVIVTTALSEHAKVVVEVIDAVQADSETGEPFRVVAQDEEVRIDGRALAACSIELEVVERVVLAVDVQDRVQTDSDAHEAI